MTGNSQSLTRLFYYVHEGLSNNISLLVGCYLSMCHSLKGTMRGVADLFIETIIAWLILPTLQLALIINEYLQVQFLLNDGSRTSNT